MEISDDDATSPPAATHEGQGLGCPRSMSCHIDPASAGAEPAAAVPVHRLGGEDQVSVHSGSSKATPSPKGL